MEEEKWDDLQQQQWQHWREALEKSKQWTSPQTETTAIPAKRRQRGRRKLKLKKRFFVFAGVVILALLVGGFLGMKSFQAQQERDMVTHIGNVPLMVDLLPEGIPGRPGTIRKIEYIVIHETGNSGSNADAASHNSYIHKVAQTEPLSWHYTVDDKEIYQHLPDLEMGFHAGDQLKEDGGNTCGIGIEMCVNPENDYEKTLENAAALTAYLMKAYGLTINDVKKHEDFSGKICPENLIKSDRWEDFLSLVAKAEK